MPLYDFECVCGHKIERIAKILEKVYCPKCKKKMIRLMPSSHGINMGVGAYGYFDDNLGKYIGSNYQKHEEMKKQGVTEKIGKGWY